MMLKLVSRQTSQAIPVLLHGIGQLTTLVEEPVMISLEQHAKDIAQALLEGARIIPLTQGYFAIVDADDYDFLNQWKWCLLSKKRGYASRTVKTKTKVRKTTHIFMHSIILKPPKGFMSDHVDRNTLDNRRKNLRCATHSQNMINRVLNIKNKSSKYKGVCWAKNRMLWEAYITLKKQKRLGSFKCEEDAARAYNKAAKKLHGKFAVLNKIKGEK